MIQQTKCGHFLHNPKDPSKFNFEMDRMAGGTVIFEEFSCTALGKIADNRNDDCLVAAVNRLFI